MRRSSHEKGYHQREQKVTAEKSIVVEKADIGGLTLMFQDRMVEISWQQNQLKRNFGLSVRFLFFSSMFQGLFFWSDLIEQTNIGNESFQLHFLCVRLVLGGISLLSCFLVSTGLLLPTQMNIFWVNLAYALPSIAIYYLTREKLSHWDSLYIVYGLSFFMLPKISPLNFIFGLAGSTVLTCVFIYISAFRLSLNEWLLSNTLLLIIFFLFMYVSYSFEKSSRERWLLRERLKRENINLDVVASSIHDDFKKTANNKSAFPLDEIQRQTYAQQIHYGEDGQERVVDDDKLSKTNRQSMNQFFKGLGAWALLLLMGNAFEMMYKPIASIQGHEVDSSATSALLMHSTGFSVFLLYFTGQIRWLILNGVVGLLMLWIFNATGIENKWVIVSTHSVGYIVLATTVGIMILVFGGVVLVWSNLIDFLKDILVRYPQVKDDLSQKKVLEQVLIRYISNIPKIEVLQSRVSASMDEDLEVENGQKERSRAHARAGVMKECSGNTSEDSVTDVGYNSAKKRHGHNKVNSTTHSARTEAAGDSMLEVMSCRRPNHCFFCLTATPSYLIPACSAWNPRAKRDDSSSEIPMCTPYTQLTFARDELFLTVQTQKVDISNRQRVLDDLNKALMKKDEAIADLESKYFQIESQFVRTKKDLEGRLAAEQELRESEVQNVISQHNAQLAELKRIHKAFHTRQLHAVQQIQAQNRVQVSEKSYVDNEDRKWDGVRENTMSSGSSKTTKKSGKGRQKEILTSTNTKVTTTNTATGNNVATSIDYGIKASIMTQRSSGCSLSPPKSISKETSHDSQMKSLPKISPFTSTSSCQEKDSDYAMLESIGELSTRPGDSEGSLESLSINEIDDLSNFFKASIEEIEALLSISRSDPSIHVFEEVDIAAVTSESVNIIKSSTEPQGKNYGASQDESSSSSGIEVGNGNGNNSGSGSVNCSVDCSGVENGSESGNGRMKYTMFW